MELDNNAHSVFLLYYHLVLVVKYRRQVFDETVSERSKEIFVYIAPKYNIMLQEWNYDKDHVQILFRAHPNSEISKFINAYKSASSRLLKKEFPQIRQKLWKECFWSQSFCLLTTGGAPIEVIRNILSHREKKAAKGAGLWQTKAYKIQDISEQGTKNTVCQNVWLCTVHL